MLGTKTQQREQRRMLNLGKEEKQNINR